MIKQTMAVLCAGLIAGVCFAANDAGEPAAVQDENPVIQGKALSEWIKQMRSENRGLQVRAAKTLSEAPADVRPKMMPKMMVLLKSERENDKFVAAQVLGDCGPAARAAVADLLPMLKGTQYERNRAAAAKALGQIFVDAQPSDETEKVAEVLASKFSDDWDSYSDVRREAVHAVGMIGPAAKKVIPKLARALTDTTLVQWSGLESQMVRAQAAWACGRMGPLAAEHVDRLIAMLQSEGERMPQVVEALGKIGATQDNVVPNVLTKMEAAASWQKESWIALQQFGTKAESVVPFAKRFLAGATFYGTGQSREREIVVCEVLKFLRVAGPKAVDVLPEVEKLANYKYPFNEEDDMTPVMRKTATETAAVLKGLPPAGAK